MIAAPARPWSRADCALLFGVSTTDPVVFAVGAFTLALVVLIASWLPRPCGNEVDLLQAVLAGGQREDVVRTYAAGDAPD